MNFTKHALERIAERSSFSPFELSSIMKLRKYVSLGVEPKNKSIELCLCFCKLNNTPLVLVRNRLTEELITLLPMEWAYQNGWPITKEKILWAKKLVS